MQLGSGKKETLLQKVGESKKTKIFVAKEPQHHDNN